MPYQRPNFNNDNNDNHSNICPFLRLYMYVFFGIIFLPQNHRSAFVIYFLIGGEIAHFDSDTMTFLKGLTIMIAHHYYKHSRWTCTHTESPLRPQRHSNIDFHLSLTGLVCTSDPQPSAIFTYLPTGDTLLLDGMGIARWIDVQHVWVKGLFSHISAPHQFNWPLQGAHVRCPLLLFHPPWSPSPYLFQPLHSCPLFSFCWVAIKYEATATSMQ